MKFRTFKLSPQLVQDIRRYSGNLRSGFTLKEDRLTVHNLEDFRGWICWFSYGGTKGTTEILALYGWAQITYL